MGTVERHEVHLYPQRYEVTVMRFERFASGDLRYVDTQAQVVEAYSAADAVTQEQLGEPGLRKVVKVRPAPQRCASEVRLLGANDVPLRGRCTLSLGHDGDCQTVLESARDTS
jgi:hypothetical protein